MHEFSIALSIKDIAEEETRKANASFIEKIVLEIGELAGVEIDSLNFVWDSAVIGSVLQNAEKNIIVIPGKAECLDCGEGFKVDQYFNECPRCNSMATSLIKGRELRVKSLSLVFDEIEQMSKV